MPLAARSYTNKDGSPRYYSYGTTFFNYGLIPQTWEDPNHIYSSTKKPGDGDPIDIVEIGFKQRSIGEIVPVKILGVIPMIDDGETDWKMILRRAEIISNYGINPLPVLRRVELILKYQKMP